MRSAKRSVALIGIGSGTAPALLYSYLRAHMQIFSPKESTRFFSDTKNYAKGFGWYESHFTDTGNRVQCEFSFDYLQNGQSASLIAKNLPDAKLLAVVENPILIVCVAYLEAKRLKLINSKISLARFIKDNPDVLLSAKQGKQLVNYFGYYSPIDFLIFTADDIRNNPLQSVKQTYNFINVDDEFIPLTLAHLVPEEEYDQTKKPGLIKRSYRKLKIRLIRLKRTLVLRMNPVTVVEEQAFVAAQQLKVDSELEKFLKDYYRDDVRILSQLLRRNLNYEWNFD